MEYKYVELNKIKGKNAISVYLNPVGAEYLIANIQRPMLEIIDELLKDVNDDSFTYMDRDTVEAFTSCPTLIGVDKKISVLGDIYYEDVMWDPGYQVSSFPHQLLYERATVLFTAHASHYSDPSEVLHEIESVLHTKIAEEDIKAFCEICSAHDLWTQQSRISAHESFGKACVSAFIYPDSCGVYTFYENGTLYCCYKCSLDELGKVINESIIAAKALAD